MIYIYNRDEEQIDILDIKPKFTREIGKFNTLEFETIKEYEKGYRVVYQYKGKSYEFIIQEQDYLRDDMVSFSYFCKDSFVENEGVPILDKRPKGSYKVAFNSIFEDTRWKLVTGSDFSETLTFFNSFYQVSVLEAFAEIVGKYNLEFETSFTFTGSKITSRKIHIKKLGEKANSRLEFGKNIVKFERKILPENIVTALYGYGKGEETESGGYGRRISFADINGGLAYVTNEEARLKYGIGPIGAKKHIFGFFIDEEETDKTKLLESTRKELERVSQPQAEYTIEAVNLHIDCDYADTVPVLDEEINFSGETRIVKAIVEGDDLVFVFGHVVKGFTDSFQKEIQKSAEATEIKITSIMETRLNQIADIYFGEDGYNYDLKVENEYGLPAGLYSFDAPIDQDPTKVIYFGAGKLLIADSKATDGGWAWKTALDGQGIVGSSIVAHSITANQLASDVGQSLDLSSNVSITQTVSKSTYDSNNQLINEKISKVEQTADDIRLSVGTKENAILKQSTQPTNPTVGQLWLDISVKPNVLWRWGGSAWNKATPTSGAEIGLTDSVITSIVETNTKTLATKSELSQTSADITAMFSAIGSTNLVVNSQEERRNSNYLLAEETITEDFIAGQTYTLTLTRNALAVGQSLALWMNGAATLIDDLAHIGNGIYKLTFVAPAITAGYERTFRIYQRPQETLQTAAYKDIQLEIGAVSSDYSPAPSELYTGITRADKDGVEVGRTDSDVTTRMSYDGLRIADASTKNELASFTLDGTSTPVLYADKVYANNVVGKLNYNITVYVATAPTGDGSGRDTNNKSDSIMGALRTALDGAKYLSDSSVINIEISAGKYTENVLIRGIDGDGQININGLGATTQFAGHIQIQNCTCNIKINRIQMVVAETNATLGLIHVSGLSNVSVTGCRLDGGGIMNAVVAVNRAKVDVESGPISSCATCFYADMQSEIYVYDTFGQSNTLVARSRAGSNIVMQYRRPRGNGTTEIEQVYGGRIVDEAAPTGSTFSITPPTFSKVTRTFYPSGVGSYYAGVGYVWDRAKWRQGVASNGKTLVGFADFGSQVKAWLESNGGYQGTVSITVSAKRDLSLGGGSVSFKVNSPSALTLPAVVRGASSSASASSTLVSAIISDSALRLQSSTTLTRDDYGGFTDIKLTITTEKEGVIMIYWNGEKWEKNKLKVTYTVEQYTDSKDGFPDGAVFEDVILTSEQESRLDEIQGIASMNVQEAVLYVREGIGSIPDNRSPLDIAIDKILELSPEQASNPTIVDIAEEWRNYTDYPRFKMLKFEGNLYKTIHPIRSFEEGTPAERPDLYERIGQKDGTTGLDELTPSSTNLYKRGAIGTWKGRVYESLYDGNGNEPDSVLGKDWWTDLGTIEEYIKKQWGDLMEITIIGLAGLTVGLVEIVKQTGIKSKLVPFLALAIGIALAFVSGDFIKVVTWQEKVLTGLMLGLSSMGLYSGGKTLGEAFKQRDEMIKMQGKVEETIIKLQEEERKILKKEEKLLATKEILGGYEAQGVIDVEEAIE